MEHEVEGSLAASQTLQKRWHWLPASPDDEYQWANPDAWSHWPPAGKLHPPSCALLCCPTA